jgi:hypothetical protein
LLSEFEKTIDALEMSIPFVEATWVSVKERCQNEKGARELLDSLNALERESTDSCMEQRPFYSLFKSYAHLCTKDTDSKKKALGEAKRALEEFRVYENNIYNEAVARLFLGLVYFECDNRQHAQTETKQAYEQFRMQSKMYPIEKYNNRENCEKFIRLISNKLKPASIVGQEGFISLPWLPVYSGMDANNDTPAWIDFLPQKNILKIDTVTFDRKPFKIYSLNLCDNQLDLDPAQVYGWAEIFGDSMNGIGILEGDFVLFCLSKEVESGEIVIASREDQAGAGLKYIINKYDKHENILFSVTDPPKKYAPISLTSSIQILGVVIAVAKPV